MPLLFHDIGLTWGVVVLFLVILAGLFAIFLRATWVVVMGKSRRAVTYGAWLFGTSVLLWFLAWQLWESFIFEVPLMVLTLPFGVVLGPLHMDLGFYLVRDAILGNLNAAHHPVTPHIYLYRAFLNAAAVIVVVEIIESKIASRKKLS